MKKINISRQSIYITILSFILLIFVLVFSFSLLIPQGKEYRMKRAQIKKISKNVKKLDNFNSEILTLLKDMQGDNRHIITALKTSFSEEKFLKQNKNYFKSLTLSKRIKAENEGEFIVYDVNTTSQMSSPKSFYDFLDSINKSDWIIGINFPIDFKRDGEMIYSTFSMKIYSDPVETNTTESNTTQ